jgi:homoserine dehydrogenase
MTHYNLALVGFGNVGQALVALLNHKQMALNSKYGLTFSVTGIATKSHGLAINPAGIDLSHALDVMNAGASLAQLAARPAPPEMSKFIRICGAQVLFENTPVNYENGQPAIDHLKLALELGMHAITANKGPVVHAYQQLTELAAANGCKFCFEATVMDGAPVFSLFRNSLPAAQLLAFEGILNSTTNLIITRMEQGEEFDQAVGYAQRIGIAETDPSGDINGWDAAVKVAALVTVLMGVPLKPSQIERKGIRGINPEEIEHARERNQRWKLVCSARRDGKDVRARVAPQMVAPNSPLFNVQGTSSILQFETDVLGSLSIIETDPGPHTTAYGLLADFINTVQG